MAADREVLSYGGRTFERRGWFTRYIEDPTDLHELIDPLPKGEGVPFRETNSVELSRYVDLEKLQTVTSDAANAARRASSAIAGVQADQATLLAQVVDLREQLSAVSATLGQLLAQVKPQN